MRHLWFDLRYSNDLVQLKSLILDELTAFICFLSMSHRGSADKSQTQFAAERAFSGFQLTSMTTLGTWREVVAVAVVFVKEKEYTNVVFNSYLQPRLF